MAKKKTAKTGELIPAPKKRGGLKIPQAAYGSSDRPLRIGEIEIPCYVLDDGRRVLSQRGLVSAMDMKRGGRDGGDRLSHWAASKSVSPFISDTLRAAIDSPIVFGISSGGTPAHGYEATIINEICDAVLDARKAGKLYKQQMHIAERCEIIVRGLSRVGIIALVDEATGYQEVRDRTALQEILDKYLQKEFAAWAKRFPDEFYKQIFRLRGWKWKGMKVNRPTCVAQYTKDLVYARLAPGILEELERRNPVSGGGRAFKHHQLLTEDVGHPALAQHLHALIGLMRASDDWKQMTKLVNRAFPKRGDTLQLELFQDE